MEPEIGFFETGSPTRAPSEWPKAGVLRVTTWRPWAYAEERGARKPRMGSRNHETPPGDDPARAFPLCRRSNAIDPSIVLRGREECLEWCLLYVPRPLFLYVEKDRKKVGRRAQNHDGAFVEETKWPRVGAKRRGQKNGREERRKHVARRPGDEAAAKNGWRLWKDGGRKVRTAHPLGTVPFSSFAAPCLFLAVISGAIFHGT
ncbi:hypothetical protein KM043_011646 [Ampulex compressa]|nr:hypothetical protein KM043_011646 [Ampulex compressa]